MHFWAWVRSLKNHITALPVCWQTYLCGERGIALVDLPQSVQHFRQLWWVHRLHGDLDNRRRVELQRPENLSLSEEVKYVNPCSQSTFKISKLSLSFISPLRSLWALWLWRSSLSAGRNLQWEPSSRRALDSLQFGIWEGVREVKLWYKLWQ